MTCYVKEDNIFWPTPNGAIDIRETLPVGTYTVGKSMKGFYLKAVENFHMTGKIYGKTPRHAERILNTFDVRPNATGVLLTGEKGSGKTMLAKIISRQAADKGMPTIIINDSFSGDDFNSFIQSIDTPSVVIFDEFEKVFSSEDQEGILTLLDGVYPTKKLFILTTNDKYRVNQHMTNRPGRIFYMIEYKGIDLQFIEEYCNDNLNNKSYIQQICRLTMMYPVFNFDMLKALVEEMNRYNETPNEALEILNAKPFMDDSTKYEVTIVKDGKALDMENVHPRVIRGNPITNDDLGFYVEDSNEDDTDAPDDSYRIELTPNDLKKIDPDNGTFTYVLEKNNSATVITFTKESYKSGYRWQDAI